MSQKFEILTPTVAFPAADAPSFDAGFEADEWKLDNQGATLVQYSFDGPQEINGEIAAGAVETFKTHARKIWIQDGAGTGELRVTARTDR